MFRYKGGRNSTGLVEEQSKISNLSSSESCSSKDGMDPGKDSWVFSKDGSRKFKSRMTSSHDDDSSYSIREENNTPSVPADENMKVNVLYRGMIYRIKGIKIMCSILAGIILLLAAVVILGIWIILGANESGQFYFPWSEKSSLNETFEMELQNVTNQIISFESDIRLPPTSIYREEISFKIPSAEVGEALSHIKAVHPIPVHTTEEPTELGTTFDPIIDTYSEYYDDYVEYYADSIDEYSLLHPTILEPPPGFNPDITENYDIYPRDGREDNFRVHISGDQNPSVEYSMQSSKEIYDESFRPSPRIPEYVSSPEINTGEEPSLLRNNQRSVDSKLPKYNEASADEEYHGPTFTDSNFPEHSPSPQKDTVVEYDGVIINSNPEDSVVYYDEEDEEYYLESTPEYLSSEENIDYIEKEKIIVTPRNLVFIEEVVVEEDPHRKLFIGNYDRGEIILESIEPDETLFTENYPTRPGFAGPSGLPGKTSIPMYNSNRPRTKSTVITGPQYPVKGRQVAGTVHPIPHIRRSHISAGFRPRLSKTNMEFLRMRDRQSTIFVEQAEKFADRVIAENVRRPPVSRMDGSLNRRPGQVPQNAILGLPPGRFPPGMLPGRQRFPLPYEFQQPPYVKKQAEGGFMNALQSMYENSKRIATSLLKFPQMSDLAMTNTTTDFLKNSFGLLDNYDHVFSNLPQVFMKPLIRFQLPSVKQIENLNPFQLSLMTWTFIDFWEFLIEKVGTLSREDLRILELRLAKVRQSKDSSMARAFIASIPNSEEDMHDQDLETAAKAFELSLSDENTNNNTLSNAEDKSETNIGMDSSKTTSKNVPGIPKTISSSDEQSEVMQYTIMTLFNFGKVYLRSDYALDCMMLLFCKDINSNTKLSGIDGVAARLKSVGLKVLTDKEGRERDTISSVWQALTKWEPLHCDVMFPKCDGSKALEIVNEVANAAR